jgi:ferric-dicitrate binding protein FerR (iron transport regulator)
MTKLSNLTKSALALAALTSVGMTMVPTEAEAGQRGRRNWALAGGVLAGLAGAALLASSNRPAYAHGQSQGYGYGHGYGQARPVYVRDCYWVRQTRETWDGYMVVRRVRVCD